MSPMFGREPHAADHDRAIELALARMDDPLAAPDAAWLETHLAGCPDCAASAHAFDADRALLRGLRDIAPEPPRDLWARTAAALEGESAGRHGRRSPARRIGLLQLAPVAGLAVVAVVVGSGLLNGAGTGDGGATALATPMALTAAGNVQVLAQGRDGSLEIQTRRVDEVCPVDASVCSVAPSIESAPLAMVSGARSVNDAILSPDKDRLVLVQRGDGAHGVYVVPMTTAAATTTGAPATLTPATATPVTTAPATVAPATPEPVAPTVVPSLAPATETPSPGTTEEPSPSSDDTTQTAAPTESPTPAVTPEPTEEPKPSPSVTVSPAPGGAIQIAKDVAVVGSVAAYNDAGTRFAFSARPADGSTGPDVFVWDTSEAIAHAITTDHRSLFAGWQAGHLLVSRVVDGAPGTYLVDPVNGARLGDRISDAWRPTVGPDGTTAVWWDGTVTLATDGVTWIPGDGRLVLGSWGDGGGAPQVLANGRVLDWQVRWDPRGTVLAVWLAGPTESDPGSLSLYRLDGQGGRANLGDAMLKDASAFEGFALENGRLAWPATGAGGKATLQIMAWNGNDVGRLELPADSGSTVVR